MKIISHTGSLRCVWLAIAFHLCHSLLMAQDYPRMIFNPEKLVDELFPQQEADINYTVLYENLLQLLSHPIELNHATGEDLRSLFILSENQIQAILKWRQENGFLLSVYELQAIPDFDLAAIYKLLPFVVVRDLTTTLDRSFLNRVISENDSYAILRSGKTLEQQNGYNRNADSAIRYRGSPLANYFRCRLSRPGDFSFGVTAAKDPGESGADFFSFHAQVAKKGWIKNLIVGDFTSQFGQGLVLGGGFGMGKGAETITTLRRSTLGFIPYSSSAESNFFRGLAASIKMSEHITIHSFISSLRRDAVSDQDTTDENYSFVSSFAVTGLHRTTSELANRHKLKEVNYGVVAEYHKNAVEAGVLYHHTQFDLPVTRKPTAYNQFSFNGTANSDASFFFNYSHDNFTLFGETAQTLGHGMASVAGALVSISGNLDLALLYRNYSRDFYSFYSNAISENTIAQNEKGFYWGWKYQLSKKYSLSGYIDYFYFPWLRYRAYSISNGNEELLRLNFSLTRTTTAFIQLRQETKDKNLSGNSTLYYAAPGIKRSLWLNLDYAANAKLNFKTRAQFSSYSLSGSVTRGMVLLHDVNFDIGKFSFTARYSLFHTDDYENRQYVYERDVLLAFTFPAYYGSGIHTFVLMQYRINRFANFWVRWSRTRYTDRQVIGSGGEQINGDVRNDIRLQIMIRI